MAKGLDALSAHRGMFCARDKVALSGCPTQVDHSCSHPTFWIHSALSEQTMTLQTHMWRQVLCASNAAHDKVDPVDPPEGSAVGERITFEGFGGTPEAVLNPKRKVFEKLAPDLQTDDSARPRQLLEEVI